jgi:hypothetical protein
MSSTPRPLWVGWYRLTVDSPWVRACEADTLGECARLLSAATRGLGIPNTHEVLTSGAPPNIPRPTSRW